MAATRRVFGEEIEGQSYSRYGNPTNDALEELLTSLESGPASLACASGMTALHVALTGRAAGSPQIGARGERDVRRDRQLLMQVMEPFGVERQLCRHLRSGSGASGYR